MVYAVVAIALLLGILIGGRVEHHRNNTFS